MYAIIESGGKQHQVAPGQQIRVEKLPVEKGVEVSFDKVLLLSNDSGVIVDSEKLSGVSVKGTVIEQDRAKKIIVFKFKRRKNYKRKQGHRQAFTAVRIDSIKE